MEEFRKFLMSQSLPNQVNDFNGKGTVVADMGGFCRNPFQTRSTTSMCPKVRAKLGILPCRNPFQTRSTTSINALEYFDRVTILSQSLPNQVNDFNLSGKQDNGRAGRKSQSLPNQVNDFNTMLTQLHQDGPRLCRNPFQTRSTTSI